jgi:hypothetical protein
MTDPGPPSECVVRPAPNGAGARGLGPKSVAGLLFASFATSGNLAFRVYLAAHGLRVIDLWNHARPPFGSPQPGAAGLAGLGGVVSYTGLSLGSAALICCLIVVVRALRRRDRRAVVFAACGALVAVIGIVLAAQLGFTIAGA